jgi:hypothetical protein
MHRWMVYIPNGQDHRVPYYKLHIYHAEVMRVQSFEEVIEHLGSEAREDAITYVIAPAVLYRNFTQRVVEQFRADHAHAYDFTATIGIDAFRDGRKREARIRSRAARAASSQQSHDTWVTEWLAERWRGAGHIPRGERLQALMTLEAVHRIVPLTAWSREPDCELDGYPYP